MALSPEQEIQFSDFMRKAQAGDKDAYTHLLQEVAAILRLFIRRRVPSEEIMEDIVQDTLLSIHASRHTYDGNKAFGPWMYALARYRLADYWRKFYRHVREEELDPNVHDSFRLDQRNQSSTLGERLIEGLTTLPERQNQIIRKLKFEGYTLKEVAQQLEMSEAAVKVAAHRGYRSLRRFLEVEMYEDK